MTPHRSLRKLKIWSSQHIRTFRYFSISFLLRPALLFLVLLLDRTKEYTDSLLLLNNEKQENVSCSMNMCADTHIKYKCTLTEGLTLVCRLWCTCDYLLISWSGFWSAPCITTSVMTEPRSWVIWVSSSSTCCSSCTHPWQSPSSRVSSVSWIWAQTSSLLSSHLHVLFFASCLFLWLMYFARYCLTGYDLDT